MDDNITMKTTLFVLCCAQHKTKSLSIPFVFAFEGSFGFIAWFIGVSLTGEYYFNKHEAKTGRSKPESEWIKLNIEPVIDQDIFKRVAELKESRSPAKMPPRVVNSPTLLTGLLKCGVCGASMTLATGKGAAIAITGAPAGSTRGQGHAATAASAWSARITLADREVVITGKSVAILQAMEKTKLGTLKRVPSFVPKWLPSTDSNRGPSG